MRILFLTNHLKGDDGWSRYSLDLISGIQSQGHEVLVLTSGKSSQDRIKELAVLAEPLKYLANPFNILPTSLRIKRIIREFSPDIIHFTAEPYVNLLPFLTDTQAKTYLTVHGTYSVVPNIIANPFGRIFSLFLSKKYFQKLTGVIAVSNYTKEYLLKHYPEISSKVRVVANGVNLKENTIVSLEKKPKNKIKQILFVGAVKERKGLLEAIEGCRHYQDRFSGNFVYNIVGHYKNDGYFKKLIKKIREYNLENKVSFLDGLAGQELQNHYLNADLFLMPSVNINHNFEGFGLVFLEANAKGIPCIGSRDCGAQEAIVDGKTGYLVDPFNPEEMAQKMDLVLNKNSIKAGNCIDWAEKNNIKIKTKELLNFYNI